MPKKTKIKEMMELKHKLASEETKATSMRELHAVRKLNKYNLVEYKKSIFKRKKRATVYNPIKKNGGADSSPMPRRDTMAASAPAKSLRLKLFEKIGISPTKGQSNISVGCIIDWSDKWDNPLYKVHTLNKVKWENTEIDGELLEQIPGWNYETGKGTICSLPGGSELKLEDAESFKYLYKDFFFKHDHTIYCGENKEGPIVICVEKGKDPKRNKFRVLVFDKKEYGKYAIEKSSTGRNRLKSVQTVCAKRIGEAKLTKVPEASHESFSIDLLKFEKKVKDEKHTNKFGVLYAKEGQADEDSMYGNFDASEHFKEFLTILGKEIDLKGHKGFRGGLDTKSNTTGVKSVFTTVVYDSEGVFKASNVPLLALPNYIESEKEDGEVELDDGIEESSEENTQNNQQDYVIDAEDIHFQIMFHVGIHLPYEYEKSDNPQQIGKKRWPDSSFYPPLLIFF